MDPLDGQPHSEVAADVLRRPFRLREPRQRRSGHRRVQRLRLRGGCPELVSVAGGDAAAVDIDFVVDELQVLLVSASLTTTWARCDSIKASRSCSLPGPVASLS